MNRIVAPGDVKSRSLARELMSNSEITERPGIGGAGIGIKIRHGLTTNRS